jgi:hypothetical protein
MLPETKELLIGFANIVLRTLDGDGYWKNFESYNNQPENPVDAPVGSVYYVFDEDEDQIQEVTVVYNHNGAAYYIDATSNYVRIWPIDSEVHFASKEECVRESIEWITASKKYLRRCVSRFNELEKLTKEST